MRFALGLSMMLSVLAAPALGQQTAPATVPVGTVVAERKPIVTTFAFVGRVEAVNRVQVVARVKGFLEAVLFKEGDLVKEGARLYRIEQPPFHAAVKQAEGALERSRSAKVLTTIQLDRAEQLVKTRSGTVVARDQAKAADDQADGSILIDEANLTIAKINLSYTAITSPISGKIGRTNFTKGNVVGPDTGPLTLIVSQDPMYVTFPVSQRIQAQRTGRTDLNDIKVRLRFSDGSTYEQLGTVDFVDVTVDKSTDTVIARATIPNPNGRLIDGQYVRIELEVGAPEERIVVPQAALIADQAGVYVFAVQDSKVIVKRVKPGRESGTGVVIEEGLTGGEQIIVQGMESIRPGTQVRATPVPTATGG